MRKIANVLIIAGLLVFLYPLLDRAYTWYWQQKIFQSWEASLPAAVEDEGSGLRLPAGTGAGGERETPGNPIVLPADTLGILAIRKIELKLPLLKGASMANLKIGAGLMEETAMPGEPGNMVLTAHRSYTYGRFFNRLDEVEAGDEIIVATLENVYRYAVYDKLIVEPDDVLVLGGDPDERILTLVTCHPIYNATHRLIVRARAIPEEKGENAAGDEKGGADKSGDR